MNLILLSESITIKLLWYGPFANPTILELATGLDILVQKENVNEPPNYY